MRSLQFFLHRYIFQRYASFPLVFTFFVIVFFAGDLFAQRITYESLRMRERQPKVFVEHLILPNYSSSGKATLVTTFRLEHKFLVFRRNKDNSSPDPLRQFYAEPSVRISFRETTNTRNDSPKQNTKQDSNDRPNSGETVATNSWGDTIYTNTFEQTQSSGLFAQNMITTSLAPGRYHIETTMTADSKTRRNQEPDFRIPDTSDTDIAYLYFLDDQSGLSPPYHAPLMNMDRNVYFGRDHKLAVWLPETADDVSYTLKIHQLRIQQRDTTVQDTVYEHSFEKEQLLTGYFPDIFMEDDRPHFALQDSFDDKTQGAFYMLRIPNSTFENAHFRMVLTKSSTDTDEPDQSVLARRTYQSLWLDMPISLYNIDVATNMMRFIVDDETLRSLKRGSRQEREQRFHEFWSQRNPNPEQEYNVLMVEYFRRIDHAYERFTTPQRPGYESDQGKIYITHGEPDRRERTYPANQPAREVWHYDSRTFIFEATTGFGDYRLVERK